MLSYFVFPNDFDGSFDLSLSMHSYSYLAERAFTKDSANLVPFFDVLNFFESFEVFECENFVIFVFSGQTTVFHRAHEWIIEFRAFEILYEGFCNIALRRILSYICGLVCLVYAVVMEVI